MASCILATICAQKMKSRCDRLSPCPHTDFIIIVTLNLVGLPVWFGFVFKHVSLLSKWKAPRSWTVCCLPFWLQCLAECLAHIKSSINIFKLNWDSKFIADEDEWISCYLTGVQVTFWKLLMAAQPLSPTHKYQLFKWFIDLHQCEKVILNPRPLIVGFSFLLPPLLFLYHNVVFIMFLLWFKNKNYRYDETH